MGQVINNVTNTNDAFRWTASFIKSGRLSSEGFLVLAFAADYPLITMGPKYFWSRRTTLDIFWTFIHWQNRRYLVKMYGVCMFWPHCDVCAGCVATIAPKKTWTSICFWDEKGQIFIGHHHHQSNSLQLRANRVPSSIF